MPFADNQGTRIHYETVGEGVPLVMQHWSLATLEDWFDFGYVDELKAHYQLILIDARGHGDSDRFYDADDYSLDKRVGDIVAVLDALHIAQAHYFGYSMGGWIGFGVARYAQARFLSLIMGGAHPYAQTMNSLRQLVQVGVEQGAEACIQAWQQVQGNIASEQRMLNYDYPALLAVMQPRENLAAVLSQIQIPCLLYAGEDDQAIGALARQCCAQIPQGQFMTIPGADHGETIRRSEVVCQCLRSFLSAIQ